MYTEQQLQIILSQLKALHSENEVVEFKEAKNGFDFRELGKYVSALSNEANLKNQREAWLVFGIENKNHDIVGSQFRPKHKDLMSLKKEIADQTNGGFTFNEIYEIEVNGLRVVMFSIPPAPKGIPIYFKGHYYARNHESLVSLNIEKIERIRSQAGKFDWSSEIVEGATIEDLDESAIIIAKENYIDKFPDRSKEILSWPTEKFLDKAKITKNGEITRTTLILLGKDESEHFLNPTECKIRWKLLDKDGNSLGYEIIGIPMILGIEKLLSKIRILKYRYIPDGSLFPQEVDTYDKYTIREALNNCIAHQDYSIGGRINVIERPQSLTFSNKGSFLPGSVEEVVQKDIPEETYRNPFLINAMFNLKMVDTEGGGIRKMFNIQAKRFFPLPEYNLDNSRVAVTIEGKVLDIEYARLLARNKNLSLQDIILLDKVQKGKGLKDDEIKYLRKNNLVEGRKGNLYLSKKVAQTTGQKERYSKVSGFDKQYYLDLICKAIKDHKSLTRTEIDRLLWNKLPENLREDQKKNKVMNLIRELRENNKITNIGTTHKPKWVLLNT